MIIYTLLNKLFQLLKSSTTDIKQFLKKKLYKTTLNKIWIITIIFLCLLQHA